MGDKMIDTLAWELLMSKLTSMADDQRSLKEDLRRLETSLQSQHISFAIDLTRLKTISSAWGAGVGFVVSTVVSVLVSYLSKHVG